MYFQIISSIDLLCSLLFFLFSSLHWILTSVLCPLSLCVKMITAHALFILFGTSYQLHTPVCVCVVCVCVCGESVCVCVWCVCSVVLMYQYLYDTLYNFSLSACVHGLIDH